MNNLNSIFIHNILTQTIKLRPYEINNNYEKTIIHKLKKKVEGICTKYGYIRKNSIKVLKLSTPKIITEHFSGDIVFDVLYSAEICNPTEGTVLKAKVYSINNMGILAIVKDYEHIIISIIIPKEHTIEKKEKDIYNSIKEDTEIYIEVLGKKNELHERQINVIGRLVDQNTLSSVNLNKKVKNKIYLKTDISDTESNKDDSDDDYDENDDNNEDNYDANENDNEYDINEEDADASGDERIGDIESEPDEEIDDITEDDLDEEDESEYVEHDDDEK
jgi:DNA-directed RNA polymerase subunit E'/Rpb7